MVTANKELLAAHGAALAGAAAAAGVDLLYEAAVAGAIPIIRPLRESLAGERIRRVMGIVNGTTNFILSTMSESGALLRRRPGRGPAPRLRRARPDGRRGRPRRRRQGRHPGQPRLPRDVVVDDVPREGISSVEPVDIAFADRLGYVVKLLAVAERFDARR